MNSLQRVFMVLALSNSLVPPIQAAIVDVPGLTAPQANAATAVQSIFDSYQARIDQGENLTPSELEIFDEARTLVHTANEILQNGEPTTYSLQVDAEGLSFALQWVAHEEFSAQGKLASEAIGAQLANVVARIETLRQRVPGLTMASLQSRPTYGFAADRTLSLATGGAAGDDYQGDERLGAFVNAGFAFGERDPTANEDAFDFDSVGLTAGLDYRLQDAWVIGTALGFSDLNAEFDSSQSVVDGEVKAKGWSWSVYNSFNTESWYLDAVMGFGFSGFDTVRRITYPSNNPLVEAADYTALGETDSTQLNASLGGGWLGNWDAWGYGTFLNLGYAESRIEGYAERDAEEFSLEIQQQRVRSLTSGLGGQISYVWSLPFGVLIPQVRAQWLHEFQDSSRNIGARFVDDTGGNFFSVPTDAPDADYGLVGTDLSAVFQYGLQGFVSWQMPVGLSHTRAHVFAGGVRWAF